MIIRFPGLSHAIAVHVPDPHVPVHGHTLMILVFAPFASLVDFASNSDVRPTSIFDRESLYILVIVLPPESQENVGRQ